MKFRLQIYTGDGKGKTTAALGQLIRFLGRGGKACFIQFDIYNVINPVQMVYVTALMTRLIGR